ncbi:MAG: NAD(P)-dependent oxidoreductase [Oscillatoriaceae bacterium SKW80]|nr:NAD(P)-dependent oxidoreductase [Oscillatoriaceae bacterium SKYG93]MCX8119871.1 NAD(P)-dependent oxidoreductase [Oscillatoriaceae bacterium SKW80]MDW8452023.1 NAD(P)-dependent oxidoreductase [Oscillatoriaceae cyanobacterium SKYGB_i_bin93]HIK27536.1 NAD(P)-dependent oxidoreductase [Oscillatoriaceae cyanobacterium M7585_C2015_266]
MKKLLITGASGFLGWNLCKIAKQQWQVFGVVFKNTVVGIEGITQVAADLRSYDSIKNLFAEIKPDAVIHAAAISQPNYCQDYPQESWEINVKASLNIAGICADNSIECVFTSTDLVFNGLNAPYSENDEVCPISVYGEQKVMAEKGMRARYPLTAICRMPLMFGYGGMAKSFIQPMLQSLREGKELALFVDEFRTPVSGETAARGLLLALEKKVSGVLHLGGKERVSRYEFMRLLVEELGLNQAKLKSCRQKDVKMAAPRPPDVSLDSSKAMALGYQPLSLREEFQKLRGIV